MPRRGSSGRSSGGGFSRPMGGGGMFSSRPRYSSGSPFRSSPRSSSARTGATAAAPPRQMAASSSQQQQRPGMGMPGLGSALGMGMALGAGSAVGHHAMNSLFGGAGSQYPAGGGGGYPMDYQGMSGPAGGALPGPTTDSFGNPDLQSKAIEPPFYESLVDYAQKGDLDISQQQQLSSEQMNQKALEQQAATDPCFNQVSGLLSCLKDNPKNIGLCQMQMDSMVSCQQTHQMPGQGQTTNTNSNLTANF